MKHIEDLQEVIHELHGVKSTHRESVPVKEVWEGHTIWDGVVEVFDIHGHPETHTAYAWSHETEDGPKHHVTVLHIPPAISPLMAVRAAIAAEVRNAQG